MGVLQDQLKRSVGSVFDLMDKGETARDAILKTASADGLLPDQVTRLCQLYNRSAALSQRLVEQSMEAKLADAQVVDPRQVLQALSLRNAEKQADSPFSITQAVLSVPSPEKNRPAQDYTFKQASLTVAEPEDKKVDKCAGLHHGLSAAEVLTLRDEIRAKIASYELQASQLLRYVDSVAGLAKQAAGKAIRNTKVGVEAIKQAAFWIEQNAPEAKPLFESVVAAAVSKDVTAARKVASLGEPEPPTQWMPGVIGDRSVTYYVVKLAEAEKALEAGLPKLVAKIAALREEDYLLKTRTTADGCWNRDLVFGDETLAEQQKAHIAKVASVINSYAGSLLAKGKPKPGGGMDRVDRFRLQLQHPQHEATLQSIRSRAALQTLLVDDPVIQSHPEDQVIAAYNEISAYAPEITQQPAALRAVLRQFLQNNASSFDLSQIRSLERGRSSGKDIR